MIGIEEIGIYLPKKKISNFELREKFNVDDNFINNKIGFTHTSKKSVDEETSDLCVNAFQKLYEKTKLIKKDIKAIIVVTQNPDFNLPHTSAIVHGKLDLPENCAAFDISLGCSGFAYGLSILESFMTKNDLDKAVLFTADPYSKIIDETDINTTLLFGDGAAATLVSDNPILKSGKFTFGTIGNQHEELICRNNDLKMNGRSIFNFAARYVPKDVKKVLEINNIAMQDVDMFAMHQGSKYIIDTIAKKLKLPSNKIPFLAKEYGNVVSSSIPFILEPILDKSNYKTILISGFGVGLSWSSTILEKISK